MSPGYWILAVLGVLLWVWLIYEVFVRSNSLLDRDPPLRSVCRCGKHAIDPGCPKHDPMERAA